MLKKRRYYLVFSLGAACACTECLRAAGLQFSSFPFDWLFGSTLAKRTDILVDGCDDWLKLENLEHVFSATVIRTEAYRNNVTGITFNHDFPEGIPIGESIGAVREKYNRRFDRLRSLISRGGRVLVVYVTSPPKGMPPSTEDAAYCRRRLSERFPAAKVEVLVLKYAECTEPLVEHPCEGVTFASFNYRSRTDTTGANPVERDSVVEFLKSAHYSAIDYRTAGERNGHRIALRRKEYMRYGATSVVDYALTKLQYKLFRHLQKRLGKKGLA